MNVAYVLRRSDRLAVCIVAVGLVWYAGIFYVPPGSSLATKYSDELRDISYTLLAVFFVIYGGSVGRFRWPTICYGFVAGYLAGVIGQGLAMSIFDNQRLLYGIERHPWQALSSPFLVSMVVGVWLGGICTGVLVLILQSAIRLFARQRCVTD
jgi:hypothetical protein